MVENDGRGDGKPAGHGAVTVELASAGPETADLVAWRAALANLSRQVTDDERIEQLRALEELKAAACAAQARVAVDFAVSQRAEQSAAGVPAAERGRGIGAQVALARRESPVRGGRLLGLATALLREMPCSYAALQSGRINEWRATLLVRESACLSPTDRTSYDVELAGDPAALEDLGDRQLVAFAKQVAYRLDAHSVVARARKAEGERRVTLRPAPDTMSYLTGLLPVAQGVSVLAALNRAADALRGQGDPRSRGQLMADLLVERVAGRTSAEAVPVEVQLVMTDRALFAGDHEPATIPGSPQGGRASSSPTALGGRCSPTTPPARAGAPWSGCVGSSRLRRRGSSSRWTPDGGSPRPDWPSSSVPVIRPAVPRGATRPSVIGTTSGRTPRAAPPRSATSRDCARPATTRSRHPAGGPGLGRRGTRTRWRPPPPPATATGRRPPRSRAGAARDRLPPGPARGRE